MELQGAARSAGLREACGDDRDLRDEVQALLDVLPRAGTQDVFPRLCPEPLRPFDAANAPDLPAVRTNQTSTQTPSVELPPGHPLGRSRVLERVAAGGMGTAYAAHDTARERKIAVNCLLAPPGDTAVDDRVLAEASAMARPSHTNGVTVHDVGVLEAQLFVAMAYVNGVTPARSPRERPRSVRQIGQYRVTGRIGQGGMGAVYAGEHVLLGRPAAIKVLLPELSRNQGMVMRFFNEARAATAIRHPGIVEIYDFGWNADGTAFIVMERLEGETLARRLARQRLGWKAALALVRQIAGALSAAHGKGIVHRDLKPDNIFLVLDPEVPGGERIKLLDFGIAKLAGESAAGIHMTRTGAVLGTPTYMSPEQCRGGSADHRADLYALGCIAFELCGGRPPFIGMGKGDVLAAHIHVQPPSIAAVGSDVPPEIERLVRQLLAKSPAERIQSAAELIRAVDTISTDGAPSTAAAPNEMSPAVTAPSITTPCGAASATTPVSMRSSAGRRSLAIRVAAAAMLGGAMLAIAVIAMLGRGEQVVHGPAASSTPAAAPSPQKLDAPEAPAPDVAPRSPPAVELAIDSIPAGAQVVLDGAVLGKTPYRGKISWPGDDLTLVVRLAGYVNKRVVAHTERSIHKTLTLVRAARVLPPGDGDHSVNPF